MVNLTKLLIILIFLTNCSFDNKSGIWKNENVISNKDQDIFKDFKTLSSENEIYNKVKILQSNYNFKLTKTITNTNWNDIFYDQSNNFKNLNLGNSNKLAFKGKKISKHPVDNFILYEDENIIINNDRGSLIVFSINSKSIIADFNFYKKKYKKIKIKINYVLEKNIIYVSDNLGYLYAYNYKKLKLLWAKNYKIPFRSNLKISGQNLIASNQNNNLYFFNKKTGDILKTIPTEDTFVKNQFVNNLSANNENIFFLNTYGSLYAIDGNNGRVIWFINLNQSLDINPSNLFIGSQIINNKKIIVTSSNQFTYVINADNGSIIFKKNFTPITKPLINSDHLFLITKNNLLVSMNLKDGQIIYSYDINKKIADFLKIKKKRAKFKFMMLASNKILIFLNNSYLLKFKLDGELEEVLKLPSKLNTYPIIVDNSLLYLDNKNKLSIIN